MSRVPLPDEIVPVELLGPGNPNLQFSGRALMTFPPDDEGRRIEWTTTDLARTITSEPYNRDGQPPRFRVADDKRPQNLNIDQRVIEVVRRHAKTIAAILVAELDVARGQTPEPAPAALMVAHPVQEQEHDYDGQEEPEIDVDSMDKDQLIAYADANGIQVDARWNVSKIRGTIHLKGLRV